MQPLPIHYHHPSSPTIAYICFDVVPAPKGAATHIQAFAHALAHRWQNLYLITVSADASAKSHIIPLPQDSKIQHIELPALGKTLIDRVLYFRQELQQWLAGKYFDVIQIRSIYEGFPIAIHKAKYCKKLLFEVNGLPSIELKYRYPQIQSDPELRYKIRTQEMICLRNADHIITPSPVTQAYLQSLGIAQTKIQVIENGVDRSIFFYQRPRQRILNQPLKLLYFGTLASWQGVNLAIEALELYAKTQPAELTIVGSARPDQRVKLQKLADRLRISDLIQFLAPLSQADLVTQMHQADVILAPLTACDRNTVQGCCPLKVLEGMACGTPVITSDLPVVRAIGHPGEHFLAVQPNSALAIAQALQTLDHKTAIQISQQADQQIQTRFTWEVAGRSLNQVYEVLQ